ncbi:protein kinase domain-containing protein [Parendozoicomonas haliclonae]|uniref:Serine/threonine-protein kinase PrkC n=1 Tax=Parendozoicomonas haliclonae TaxID=1960125 RepID=A0A1X7ANX6_9GAMM|nr:protein kinase [Parendozoicomonas haliclonae]SMA50021.1 Serine/threonine-protein kinase PrkC [Parendozoicomonas haliclonae]
MAAAASDSSKRRSLSSLLGIGKTTAGEESGGRFHRFTVKTKARDVELYLHSAPDTEQIKNGIQALIRTHTLTECYSPHPSEIPHTTIQGKSASQYTTVRGVAGGRFSGLIHCQRHENGDRCGEAMLKFGTSPPDVQVTEGADKRSLENEIAILGKLEHPNIIAMLGYIPDQGNFPLPTLVMPFCPYKLALARDASLPYAKQKTAELFHGLDYLKQQQIVHRDIKPDNLLVNAGGCLVITDFGFARTLDEQGEHRSPQVGTPYYMAPEAQYPTHQQLFVYSDKSDCYAAQLVAAQIFGLVDNREQLPAYKVPPKYVSWHQPEAWLSRPGQMGMNIQMALLQTSFTLSKWMHSNVAPHEQGETRLLAHAPDKKPYLALLIAAGIRREPENRLDAQQVLKSLEVISEPQT